MDFDWQEFLNLADQLIGIGTIAAYRCAISRAYYSFFNPALARAEKNNCFKALAIIEKGMHARCWEAYLKGPDPNCRQIGIDGSRLRERRVRADYKSGEYRRLDEDAKDAVEDAKSLHKRLAALDARYPMA